jgi:hypothetical protein
MNLLGFKNLITFDIETLNIKGELIPYCVSFFNGKNFEYEYGNHNIIKEIFNKLLIKKYNNHVVYVHNLSNFD